MSRLKVLLATATLAFASFGLAQSAGDAVLQAMEAKLATLRMRFADQHPEVVALLRRIEAHNATLDPDSSTATNTESLKKLQAARVRLAELRRQHTDKHPDVQRQIELVRQLEQEERK
jgi:capsule polysaccharide export protein KpsE/RkpR